MLKESFELLVNDRFEARTSTFELDVRLLRASPLSLIVVSCVILLSAYYISYDITSVGISGVDSFTYLNRANLLLHQGYTGPEPRYAAYLLDAASLLLFGYHDWSARALIGACYLLNIALVFIAVLHFSSRGLISAFASGCYAFLPSVRTYARIELTHTYGATLLLGAVLCAMYAIKTASERRRQLLFAGSGLFGVLAIFTHEDLTFAVAGLTASLALVQHGSAQKNVSQKITKTLLYGSYMMSGAMLAVFICLTLMRINAISFLNGIWIMKTVYRAGDDPKGLAFITVVGPRILHDFVVLTLGKVLFCAALFAALMMPFLFARPAFRNAKALAAIPIIVACYFLGFIFIIWVYVPNPYVRFQVPLVAPIIIFTMTIYALVLRPIRDGMLAGGLSALTIGLFTWYGLPKLHGEYQTSDHRRIFDAALPLVSVHSKLLIPECYWEPPSRDFGVSSFIYLGSKAIPLSITEPNGSLSSLIAQNSIQYILVLSNYSYRGDTTPRKLRSIFAHFYGVALPGKIAGTSSPGQSFSNLADDATVKLSTQICMFESNLLRSYITSNSGRPVADIPGVGVIYKLPKQ